MTRSTWKGPFIDNCFIRLLRDSSRKNLRIWSRRSSIVPELIKKRVFIYNGRYFVRLSVAENMIGHRFGEFAKTRRNVVHKKQKKKQNIKRQKR